LPFLRQVHIGEYPVPDKVRDIESTRIPKPYGGFWTSTYVEGQFYCSHWAEFCHRSGYERGLTGDAWLLLVNPKAKVYHIRTIDDYRKLQRWFPAALPFYEGERVINWARFFENFDGLHLTKKAMMQNRDIFEFWDVESTVWGKWCFIGRPTWLMSARDYFKKGI
jgi:hypothetical protein